MTTTTFEADFFDWQNKETKEEKRKCLCDRDSLGLFFHGVYQSIEENDKSEI